METVTFHIHALSPVHLANAESSERVAGGVRSVFRREKLPAIREQAINGAVRRAFEFRAVPNTEITFSESALLLAPIRSSRESYLWCTTRSILERYLESLPPQTPERDEARQWLTALVAPEAGQALLPESFRSAKGERIFLEEYQIAPVPSNECGKLGAFLAKRSFVVDDHAEHKLMHGLCILPESVFDEIVSASMVFEERVRISRAGSTALLPDTLIEFVPTESIFFGNAAGPDIELFQSLADKRICSALQIGRDENVGKGFCRGSFELGKPEVGVDTSAGETPQSAETTITDTGHSTAQSTEDAVATENNAAEEVGS